MIQSRSHRILWGAAILIIVAIADSFYSLANFRLYLYAIPYLVSGHFVLYRALQNSVKGHIFDEFSLMSLATIGAFVIGEYPEGVFVMLFYEIGEFAQHKAVKRVENQIKTLVDKRPENATVLQNGDWREMKAADVPIDATLLIKQGERVPIDGVLKEEEGVFNTADITGESVPRQIEKGETVPSGFINTGSPVQIKSTKEFENSTFSRIIQLTRDAAAHKAPTEHFFRKFAKIYTPIVALLAVGIFLVPALFVETYTWQIWLYRACVFLVISCPCALVLSIPLTYFAGIGAAGKAGILIKGSNYIDQLTRLSGIVFDKTGTLTTGKLAISKMAPSQPTEEYLQAIGDLAGHSTHPASRAIAQHLGKHESKGVTDIREETGKGVVGIFKGHPIKLGAPKWVDPSYDLPQDGDTVILVSHNDEVICEIHLADKLKEDAGEVMNYLKGKNLNTYLLSGDLTHIVNNYARDLGFYKARGEVDPETKLKYYKEWKQNESRSLAFVGDGVNDSIALVASDLGIAMGNTGSDVAIESADVVIPGDRLSHLPELLEISGQTKRILWQNIILVFLVKLLVLALGGTGFISLWMAIIADVGIAIVAVLNAGRLIFYKPKWR